jgi:hypothetical protein
MKAGSRAAKLCREAKRRRGKAIAVVVMVDSSIEICLRELDNLAFATALAVFR